VEFLGIERVEQSAPGVKNKVFEDGVGESGKKTTPAQITFDELSLRYSGCQLVESRLAPLLSDSVDAVEFSIVLNREEHLRAIGRVRKDGQQRR
jgi:hypothetical protein